MCLFFLPACHGFKSSNSAISRHDIRLPDGRTVFELGYIVTTGETNKTILGYSYVTKIDLSKVMDSPHAVAPAELEAETTDLWNNGVRRLAETKGAKLASIASNQVIGASIGVATASRKIRFITSYDLSSSGWIRRPEGVSLTTYAADAAQSIHFP